MSLDPKFQKFSTASPIIASFNYTDVADGTGKINVNGTAKKTSAGTTYNLESVSDNYSTSIETTSVNSDGTQFVKMIDLDFDLATFNKSRTLFGTSTFQICQNLARANTGSGGQHLQSYIIIKVRKWDGATETEIGSVQSQTITDDVVLATGTSTIHLMDIEIATRTNFAKGDTLRVTIEGWSKAQVGGYDARLTIGHDPQNRDGTYIIPSTDDPETLTTFKSEISFDITE